MESLANIQREMIYPALTESVQPSSLSMYRGQQPATQEQIIDECKRLRVAFPQMPETMIAVLMTRCVENRIESKRLHDAVNNLIDTFHYPVPTIADVIGFDRKVKLFTHQEVVESLAKGYTFDNYEVVELGTRKFWTLK